jgi:NAD(P)-dependent dehydrogenase (short-subunit alcohol dehydrogenase family)
VPSPSGRISPAATSSRYLLDGAIAAFGHIEILVNNAAIAPLTPIAQATEEQINAGLDVNVKGTVFGCQLAAERRGRRTDRQHLKLHDGPGASRLPHLRHDQRGDRAAHEDPVVGRALDWAAPVRA